MGSNFAIVWRVVVNRLIQWRQIGSCALCVMSESSSGEDAQTTPPSSCRGSENGEGISPSDEVISAHPAFQQP